MSGSDAHLPHADTHTHRRNSANRLTPTIYWTFFLANAIGSRLKITISSSFLRWTQVLTVGHVQRTMDFIALAPPSPATRMSSDQLAVPLANEVSRAKGRSTASLHLWAECPRLDRKQPNAFTWPGPTIAPT